MSDKTQSRPADVPAEPVSQFSRKGGFFSFLRRPAFMRDLPYMRLPPADDKFQLLPEEKLEKILAKAPPEMRQEIRDDMQLLQDELFRFFTRRDRLASVNQNRYRLFQILYILLALFATILGSAQALAINSKLLPWYAFAETAIALTATMLATISSFEPPFPKWVQSRRIAEFLRQEYFRYMMRAEPYDNFTDPALRKMHLARRAAEINQGRNPDIDRQTTEGAG
jgi:hypothetical protein